MLIPYCLRAFLGSFFRQEKKPFNNSHKVQCLAGLFTFDEDKDACGNNEKIDDCLDKVAPVPCNVAIILSLFPCLIYDLVEMTSPEYRVDC